MKKFLPTLNGLSTIDDQEFDEILEKNKQNCMFCKPPSEKKILIETENFLVTFDDAPLLEGHVLIHSKEHWGCSGEIPKEFVEEFTDLKLSVGNLIKKIYGQVSFYEHGRAGHCGIYTGEILCEHFHMHALPLKNDISEIIKKKFKEIKIENFYEVMSLYEQFDQYLYFENEKSINFYTVTRNIPNHYIRTIVADIINSPKKADWQSNTNVNWINAFKEKIKDNL